MIHLCDYFVSDSGMKEIIGHLGKMSFNYPNWLVNKQECKRFVIAVPSSLFRFFKDTLFFSYLPIHTALNSDIPAICYPEIICSVYFLDTDVLSILSESQEI